ARSSCRASRTSSCTTRPWPDSTSRSGRRASCTSSTTSACSCSRPSRPRRGRTRSAGTPIRARCTLSCPRAGEQPCSASSDNRPLGEAGVDPAGFSFHQIVLTAVIAAVAAYVVLRLAARELRERDQVAVAVLVGLATFVLRWWGNVPALNDDFLPVVSPN